MLLLWIVFAAICFVVVGFLLGTAWTETNSPKSSYDRVREFHEKFGHPVADKPTIVNPELARLRVDLIQEELDEYREAIEAGDVVAIADALGDLDYVVNGAAIVHGIDLPTITAEIHRSNMTKLGPDGKPIYREDGKILKGKDYQPPQLAPLLEL